VLLDCYAKELSKVEYFIEKQAKQHHGAYLYIIRSFPGIGQMRNTMKPIGQYYSSRSLFC